jgi:gliding motility-associated-like protein
MVIRKFRRSFAEIYTSMRFASVLFFTFFIAQINLLSAQTTTHCLEVENILADACSQPEGDNEMVRILIGPNPITVSNLNVAWPPSSGFSFLGWRRDATTANKTQQINATITSCGYLLEPLTGVIPANKKAIIITSYTASATANSFANLSDTLYVLYQNSTNRVAGHFANYGTPPALRPLNLTYQGCTETVEYDRALLTGGDGAYIQFAQNGTATYGNNGCTAPVTQFSVDAGPTPAAVCPGATVSLSGSIIGSPTFRQWTGGTGTFSSPATNNTNYTLGANQTSPFWLYFSAKGACADTLKDSVLITIQQPNPIVITASGPTNICPGTSLTLTASGGGSSYQWVGGPATAQYTINTPGSYQVLSSDGCYNYNPIFIVTAASAPSISINQNDTSICNGSPLQVTVTASGNITWNNGATGNAITVNAPGQYIATVSNTCGTASDTLNVGADVAPNAQITNSLPINICPNTDVLLTGTGNGTLKWSNGQTGTSTTVNGAGTYTLISQTACGSDTATITINEYPLNAQFTADPIQGNVPLIVNVTNQSTGELGSVWAFGDGTNSTEESPSHTYSEPGTYTLVLSIVNAQGCTDTASVQIVVVEQMTVELPNIFTPNGDNANDVYFIKTQGVSKLKAEIYNRWGQKMFSWNDPDVSWNGKSPFGSAATPGVYFCIVEATDALGKTQTFKTTITLIQ